MPRTRDQYELVRKQHARFFKDATWSLEDIHPRGGPAWRLIPLPVQVTGDGVKHQTDILDFAEGVRQVMCIAEQREVALDEVNLNDLLWAGGSGCGNTLVFPRAFYGSYHEQYGELKACVCTHKIVNNFMVLHVPLQTLIVVGCECVKRLGIIPSTTTKRCHLCYQETRTLRKKRTDGPPTDATEERVVLCVDCRKEECYRCVEQKRHIDVHDVEVDDCMRCKRGFVKCHCHGWLRYCSADCWKLSHGFRRAASSH